ncbi:MAG: tetratricopeptide repeat protein [Alphaproteobacteria bacterium]
MTADIAPSHDALSHFDRANDLQDQERLEEAVAAYDEALRLAPHFPEALFNRGVALQALGRLDEAATSWRQAAALRPAFLEAHLGLAHVSASLGRDDEAIASFREVVRLVPDHADTWLTLGVILKRRGRADAAAEACGRAVALAPDLAIAHHTLGLALEAARRFGEAVAPLLEAARLMPDHPDTRFALGSVFAALGRLDEAEAATREAVRLRPDYAEAWANLGTILTRAGRGDEAIDACRRAIAVRPDLAAAHNNLGAAFERAGRLAEAIDSLTEAVRLAPGFVEARCGLGSVLAIAGRLDEAEANLREALRLSPTSGEAHDKLGGTLAFMGRFEEAVEAFRTAIEHDPGNVSAHCNLLLTMLFLSRYDSASVIAAAHRFGALLEAPFKARWTTAPRPNVPDPERRLKIGYLSPSLTGHIISLKIGPVLRLHRRDRFEIHVYAQVPQPDAVTWRLKGWADAWTFIHTMSDDEVAARIAADGIDILVDTMTHWKGNRLPVFARKPAPIQVTYFPQGLPSGLTAMDYIISDRWLNHEGQMQARSTSQVIELETGSEATEWDMDIPIGDAPSVEKGFVTFGCFNNPAKLSDDCLRLWSEPLRRVPSARLLIKGRWLAQPENRARLSARLAEFGISAGRLDLMAWIPGASGHMAAHDLVDIMLDTIPFNGGQTTIDALWMGVPVVSLLGDPRYGSYTFAHLNRIGAPELCARTAAEYADIAVALAQDLERRRHYRRALRPMMQASSLFDPAAHVAELEEAYRGMWRRWCGYVWAKP